MESLESFARFHKIARIFFMDFCGIFFADSKYINIKKGTSAILAVFKAICGGFDRQSEKES